MKICKIICIVEEIKSIGIIFFKERENVIIFAHNNKKFTVSYILIQCIVKLLYLLIDWLIYL